MITVQTTAGDLQCLIEILTASDNGWWEDYEDLVLLSNANNGTLRPVHWQDVIQLPTDWLNFKLFEYVQHEAGFGKLPAGSRSLYGWTKPEDEEISLTLPQVDWHVLLNTARHTCCNSYCFTEAGIARNTSVLQTLANKAGIELEQEDQD